MAASAPVVQLFNTQVGKAKESTVGTYVAPASAYQFDFATLVKIDEIIEDNVDESYQGIESKELGFYPGFRYAKITIKGIVSQLPFGQELMGFFGKDTKTGTVDPVTHAFAMLGAIPPSYSLSVYDGTISNTRAFSNCYLQALTIQAGSKGLVTYESIWIGKFGDLTRAKPTAVYDTALQYIPYQASLTLNSVANTNTLLDLTLKFDREVVPIFGFTGTQDLSAVSANRVTVSGDLMFAPIVGTTTSVEYDLYRGNTQGNFSVTFTNTASHTLNFTLTKCAFVNGTTPDYGSPYVKVKTKIKGIRNTTDVGPAAATLINTLTTAY